MSFFPDPVKIMFGEFYDFRNSADLIDRLKSAGWEVFQIDAPPNWFVALKSGRTPIRYAIPPGTNMAVFTSSTGTGSGPTPPIRPNPVSTQGNTQGTTTGTTQGNTQGSTQGTVKTNSQTGSNSSTGTGTGTKETEPFKPNMLVIGGVLIAAALLLSSGSKK